MLFERLFHILVGSASAAFTGAAFVSYIAQQKSAFFFTTAAASTAFLFLMPPPETQNQILLVCLSTAVAELAAVRADAYRRR